MQGGYRQTAGGNEEEKSVTRQASGSAPALGLPEGPGKSGRAQIRPAMACAVRCASAMVVNIGFTEGLRGSTPVSAT